VSPNQRLIQWQTIASAPVTVGDAVITLQSQALVVRCPWGRFVWNRPVAVLVERNDQVERIPIWDVTRLVQVGLLGFILTFWIVISAMMRRKRRITDE
jgi:hypothetical protein